MNSPRLMSAPERVRSLDETPLERARRRTDEARVLDGVIKSSWAMVGILCRNVRRDRDWELVNYGSFPAWREDVMPFSKSFACHSEKMIGELDGWADEEVLEIPYSTAKLITSKIPKSRQTPELKKAAQRLKPEDFEEKVIKDNGDLHIERKSWMNLPASESQKTIYDEAREVYRVLEGDPEIRWVDFFEYLCAEYTLRYKAEAREKMKR